MAFQWLRRALLLAASALLLAGCGGGGEIEDQLNPSRIISFGDAMADLGNTGGRYTVNDGSLNNWTLTVASNYGRTLAPRAAGGLAFGVGNARVVAEPDAAGDSSTPTVQEQISAFLATGAPREDDLILVGAGTSDLIVQVRAVLSGQQSQSDMLANVSQAAIALAGELRRLVNAGARHVVILGPYNLGRSAWANETGQGGLMTQASSEFNKRLKIALDGLGGRVLYIDAEQEFNLFTSENGGFDLDNSTSAVCTTVDAGEGIGTGTGQINSRTCTTATVVAGANYQRWLFADRVYPTPRGHQLLGDFAWNVIRNLW